MFVLFSKNKLKKMNCAPRVSLVGLVSLGRF